MPARQRGSIARWRLNAAWKAMTGRTKADKRAAKRNAGTEVVRSPYSGKPHFRVDSGKIAHLKRQSLSRGSIWNRLKNAATGGRSQPNPKRQPIVYDRTNPEWRKKKVWKGNEIEFRP